MVESKEITPEIRSQVLFSPTNIRGGAGIRAGAAIRRYTVLKVRVHRGEPYKET